MEEKILSAAEETVAGAAVHKNVQTPKKKRKWTPEACVALLRANSSAYQALESDLYELPSMYDAFLEFNRLGIPSDKPATDDGTKMGYGVAKPMTEDRTKEFTSGGEPHAR